MKLDFISLAKLSVSKANMRHARRDPDVSDILPTVRTRGILQPLIVRPCAAKDEGDPNPPGEFEILGGARRFHAARLVAEERRAALVQGPVASAPGTDAISLDPGEIDCIPCAILESGDDADAIEASLIENLARRDPDEVTRWETFTRLVRQGRSVGELSATFGMPERAVRRVLALGNLLPRIRTLYSSEQIDAATVRHLTLASKARQKDWLALFDDPEQRCPTGHQLKSWLFGGAAISTSVALFDLADYPGQTIADLFGDEAWFTDADQFWSAQNAAIEARRIAYLEAGWRAVVVLPPSQHFALWEHEKAPKRKGGRVYIDIDSRGHVAFHEGYLTRKEARRVEAAPDGEGEGSPLAKPARAEVTNAMQTYIDLHRHAAVRAQLTDFPQVALRLMVAHAIAGSPLWSVQCEPQATKDAAIRESVATGIGETAFAGARRDVLALLGFDAETASLVRDARDRHGVAGLFLRLMRLDDSALLSIVAVVMGESLASGSAAVEAAGSAIGVDMRNYWEADTAFFEAIRDREVLIAIVAEVAGETVASANAREKGATLKAIIAAHLRGEGGRARVENWVPRWMAFPPSSYTSRGGVGSVAAHRAVEAARADLDVPIPDASDPDALLLGASDPDTPNPVSVAAGAKGRDGPDLGFEQAQTGIGSLAEPASCCVDAEPFGHETASDQRDATLPETPRAA